MSSVEVSQDHEQFVVSGLLKNPYAVAVVENELNDGYFTDISSKIIFKSLMMHYKKYKKLPIKDELILSIDSSYIDLGEPIETIKSNMESFYAIDTSDEDFLLDKIVELIKKVRVSRSLGKALDLIKNGQELDNEKVVRELISSLEVSVKKSNMLCLSDLSGIVDARRQAIGDSDESSIIRSILPSLNQSLQYRGYQKGTLNLIVSPPGCFVGDTRIMTLDGGTHTIEELYSKSPQGVYGCTKDGRIETATYDSVYLSKYTKELVDVEIEGNVIRCTPDHPFMLRDGSYKRADLLSAGDELMPITRTRESLYSLGKEYEVVYNKDNVKSYTHHLSAELVEGSGSVVHHKDLNRFNNLPNNIQWVKNSSAHAKLHYESGDYESWVENGKPTRFTSESTRAKNLERWHGENSDEYRTRMREVSRINGSKYGATQLNSNRETQIYRRKCKALSFVNSLMKSYTITVDNYDTCAAKVPGRKVWLIGVAKAYDCSIDVDGRSRSEIVDYDKLRTLWDSILDDASKYNHKVTKVTPVLLDEEVPVYGIVEAGVNHNYAIALDDNTGVIVSNTGKTSYLINEGAYAAMQGFKVLHIFLGDMVHYDGFVRYISSISGKKQSDVVSMNEEEMGELINKCNTDYPGILGRINLLAYGAGELTVDQMIENVKKVQEKLETKFEMVIVDYADNLEKDATQMYAEGGLIYDRLALFGRVNGSVIMVASQPKINYWNTEIIPLEGAAESSRKQHIVDLMITFNLVARESNLGTMFLPKVRRGTGGRLIRVRTDWASCRLQEITEDDYVASRAEQGF